MDGIHLLIARLCEFAWIALLLLCLGSIALFWKIFQRDFARRD